MKQTTEKIDPICLIHGKKMSEHHCLYCCLCFKSLTIDECNINEMGAREDVCRQCAQEERIALLQSQNERLVEALEWAMNYVTNPGKSNKEAFARYVECKSLLTEIQKAKGRE